MSVLTGNQPTGSHSHGQEINICTLFLHLLFKRKRPLRLLAKKGEKTERPENKCLQLCGIAFKDPYPKFRSKIFLSTSSFLFLYIFFLKKLNFLEPKRKNRNSKFEIRGDLDAAENLRFLFVDICPASKKNYCTAGLDRGLSLNRQ